jgi:hypothetical protein
MRTCSVACCPARISSTPLASTSGALPSYHPLVITPCLFLFRSPFFRRIALGARALFCQPAGLRARPSVHAAQGRGRVKGRKRLWRSSDLARSRTPALESRRNLGGRDPMGTRHSSSRYAACATTKGVCWRPPTTTDPGGRARTDSFTRGGVDGMATSFFSPCISPLPALCSNTVCKTTGCNSCGGGGRLSRATTCVAVQQIKLMAARL